MAKQYFNLRNNSGWPARSNSTWVKFLNDNAVWNGKGGQVDGTWNFSVPTDAYYSVSGSCDNWGTVWIDGMQVLDIRDFNNAWVTSVWLTAGNHSIRVYGKDTGGDYGIAVTVEESNTYFNLKNFAMRNWGWAPRTDGGWCNFLNSNAAWPSKYQKDFNQGTEFRVPAKAYYTVTASCDDNGYVEIDGKRVVTIKDYKSCWSGSVLLEAGNHWVQVYGKDNGGNYGAAVSIDADVTSQISAQNNANQAQATANAAKTDYDKKQAQAVSAEAAVGEKVTTDIKITYLNGPVSASGSASASAGASAGAEAHAGVDGNYASAGASAGASASASATASGSASVGNSTASIGASGSATAYAEASATATAEAGAGLQGNNVSAGGSVEIVVRTEAGVSAEAQANATLLGIQLAEAQAQGSASTYTEVYVRADGSVSIGENGASVSAGAIAGYGIGAGAQGSAGVTTVVGGADVSGGAEVSIGAQIGAEGEAHATLEGNKVSIGISGEAAILVGLDADVNVDLDFGPTVDAVNMALNSGKTIDQALSIATTNLNQTAVAYNKTQDELQKFADQCLKAAKDAEKVYNDAARAATDAANQAAKVANDAIATTEKTLKDAGKTISNGVVDIGNQAVSGVTNVAVDAGKAIGNAANDAWNATKKFFSDIRLKENITKVGEVDGINVYTYNYLNGTNLLKGVMAQELLGTKYEDAVSIHKSGFYQVDYSKLPTLH